MTGTGESRAAGALQTSDRTGDVADLLVIGGGIVGTWTAYRASRTHSSWRIVLAERSLVGGGATRFSLGLSLPFGRNERHRRLAMASARDYAELVREVGELPGRRVPLAFVVPRERVAELQRSLVLGEGRQLDGEARRAFIARFPGLLIADEEVVIDGVSGCYSEPAHVAVQLARLLRDHPSAEVWEGTEVRELGLDPEGVRARLADGRELLARRAIVATGPMLVSGPVAERARARGLRVKKIVALHLEQCPTHSDPVLFFPADDAFLLPNIERRQWLFSYTSLVWDCPADPSGHMLTQEDRAAGMALLRSRWPELAATCTGGRASCDSYAPDWTPVVDTVDRAGRIVLAGGCSGSGWRLAPAIASEAIQLVSRGPP